jgi:carboxylesterase type B
VLTNCLYLQIYFFKNIRFAAPPVGNLRFAKPTPPILNDTIQTGAYGKSCVQSSAKPFSSGEESPKTGGSSNVAGVLSSILGWLTSTFDLGTLQGGAESGEDCLFLDLYVPGKALKGQAKLPIINWIYGGENIPLKPYTYLITNRCHQEQIFLEPKMGFIVELA